MLKKLLIFIGLLISITIIQNNVSADIISSIPLKKPTLTFEELDKKITKNILKPIKKPKKIDKTTIKEKKITQSEKKTKLSFKIPKKKPTVSGVNTNKTVKISKYYSKKDFGIAKRAISEMKKSKWSTSLEIAKKAKDKSIYNFIQWRHLLTKGNQASFYDYKTFMDSNEDYPRIGRVKYLSEHKLSTDSISPKKIIQWFGLL